MNAEAEERLLILLEQIVESLAIIAGERDAKDGPEIQMPLSSYKTFDWSTIGAKIIESDIDGPTMVHVSGKMYQRRNHPKFGADIWYSRYVGKAEDGTPEYAKLIEFRPSKEDGVSPLDARIRGELGKTAAPQNHARPVPAAVTTPPAEATTPAVTTPKVPLANNNPRHDYKAIPHPWDSPIVVDWLQDVAAYDTAHGAKNPNGGEYGATLGIMDKLGDHHPVIQYVFQVSSAKDLTPGQRTAFVRWVRPEKAKDGTNAWVPSTHFAAEYRAVLEDATLFYGKGR